MTDSPSFREIAEESVMQEEATPETSVEQVQTEQPETTQEEVFAEKGELAGRTPEQLEEIHKNWQRSYTEKRQKETHQLKELQAELEMLRNQPQAPVVPQDTSVQERAEEAQQALDVGQMTVSQYTDYMRALAIEEARNAARDEFQTQVTTQREETLAETALEQFQTADTRLSTFSPEFNESFRDEVQRELADVLDEHLETTGSYKGFDTATVTKQIVERRDQELDDIIKKRTIDSTKAAQMREAKAKKSQVRGSTSNGQPVGGNSFRDILNETLDGAA